MELNKERIYLFCEYNRIDSGRELVMPPAAITWVDYIVSAIKKTGRSVTIVSISGGQGHSYLKRKRQVIDNQEDIVYLPAFDQKGNFLKLRFSQFIVYINVFLYIFFKTKKKSKLIIYHSYGFSLFINTIKWVFNRCYIYLVGEVFSAVYCKGKNAINNELSMLNGADGYIYVNNLLSKYIDDKRPCCVCHGSYALPTGYFTKINDSQTHIVYAGKISTKDITDAFVAVESAKYLNSMFRVHILGYGLQEDIDALQRKIDKINKEHGFQIISYDGCLSGPEYDEFLCKCDIGLCTRVLEEPNSSLCFPSKTVVYLTHGLTAICPDIPVLRESSLASFLAFIPSEFTAKDVAKAIIEQQKIPKEQITAFINELDNQFVESIDKTLDKIYT